MATSKGGRELLLYVDYRCACLRLHVLAALASLAFAPMVRAGSPANHGLPVNGLIKNGIAFGWLPDEENSGTIAHINAVLGGPTASTDGHYSQISSLPYDGTQLLYTSRFNDIVNADAVFIPAVMPTNVKFSDITLEVGQEIAAVMKKFTDRGVEIWLRFAHEFNWYVQNGSGSNGGPEYVGGTQSEFISAWKNVYQAVQDAGLGDSVKLFWSPNNVGNDASGLENWWPGQDFVDIVGIDVYPADETNDFDYFYGDFYERFSAPYGIPFALGETGVATSDASLKEWWLRQITASDLKGKYPNYISASWFEYYKGNVDFRIITGDAQTADETRTYLLG